MLRLLVKVVFGDLDHFVLVEGGIQLLGETVDSGLIQASVDFVAGLVGIVVEKCFFLSFVDLVLALSPLVPSSLQSLLQLIILLISSIT